MSPDLWAPTPQNHRRVIRTNIPTGAACADTERQQELPSQSTDTAPAPWNLFTHWLILHTCPSNSAWLWETSWKNGNIPLFCREKVWRTRFLSLKNLSSVKRSRKSQSSKNPSCTEERKFSFFSPNNNKKTQTNQELNVSPVKLTLQAGSPWRWVLSLQHRVTPCKAMHTGKNNPNYTHDMTGFSSVVIKQKPSDSMCASTFRVASSALQQSKRQEHF